jgi:hypothetical protein
MERKSAKAFVGFIALCGFAVLGYGLLHLESRDHVRFFSFLAVAALASRLKVKLPGLNGNMSVNLPFILMGVIQLGLFQTLMVACACTLVQSIKVPLRDIKPVQALFNFCNMALAVGLAHFAFRFTSVNGSALALTLRVAIAAGVFFLANTTPVSAVISLTEVRRITAVWKEIFLWSFPYYLLSAGIAAMFSALRGQVGWEAPLFLLPVMLAVYRSFRAYFSRAARGHGGRHPGFQAP